MIQADFYPTFFTDPVASDVEYTDNIGNLTQSIDMFHPYVMGYMTSTYIPSQFLLSTYKATVAPGMDDDGIEFEWAMERQQNIPWFFLASRHTTLNAKRIGQLVFQDGAWSDFNNAWTAQTYQNYQLLNSFDISLIKLRTFTFAINYAIWDDTRLASLQVFTTSTSIAVDTETLIDFLENNGTLSFNVTMSGYSETIHTVTFSSIDMIPGMAHLTFTAHHVATDQDCEIHIRFVISQVHWNVSRIATEGGTSGQYPSVTVAYQYKTKDDNLNVVGAFNSGTSLTANYIMIRKDASRIFDIESGVNVLTVGDTKYVATGLQGKIPGSFVRNAPLYQILQQTTFVAQVVGSTRVVVVPYILTEEIQKILWQCGLRIADETTPYGFSDDVYVPQYKTDDSPNYELLNGDFATIGGQLRPWQIGNITDDEFTWDDVPPYNPEPPGGEDSGGDDIRPSDWTNLRIGAANNFVTLYGMTAETVSDFGRKMWAQLADPEFWQMVGTAFTNDFSINPADMMRYFVSLRYFPFDVSDFAHSTSSGVYIGRAASPIAPSIGVAYPIRLTNNVVQVYGGSLTISRYYNDYRDYEPCTTVQVHVPFCGSVEIPASEVMGHTLDLTYKLDLQTGAMLAVLCVQSNTYYVIATLAGTVGASIPITANNNIEFLQRIATLGGGLVGGGVSGALKGAMLGGEVGAVVGAVAGTVGGGVGALAGLPPVTVHKQGNASGFANLGGVPYAYATIQHSRFELPDNYGHTTGYACDFAAKVSDLSGYTVCDNVDTSGLSCNSHERDEIKRLLESGVYV